MMKFIFYIGFVCFLGLALAGCTGPSGAWSDGKQFYTLSDGVYALSDCGSLMFATNEDSTRYVPLARFKIGRKFVIEGGNPVLSTYYKTHGKLERQQDSWFASGSSKCRGNVYEHAWNAKLTEDDISLDEWVHARLRFKSENANKTSFDKKQRTQKAKTEKSYLNTSKLGILLKSILPKRKQQHNLADQVSKSSLELLMSVENLSITPVGDEILFIFLPASTSHSEI